MNLSSSIHALMESLAESFPLADSMKERVSSLLQWISTFMDENIFLQYGNLIATYCYQIQNEL